MDQFPASLDLLSGLLTLGSVLVAVWLDRATLPWALDLRGPEGEASVVWARGDRRLAWIVLSGASCLALPQITSVSFAVVELPAVLTRLEGSGVQILPVSQWVNLGDPLGGYLAWWVASIGVMAAVFIFVSSRVDRSEFPGSWSISPTMRS